MTTTINPSELASNPAMLRHLHEAAHAEPERPRVEVPRSTERRYLFRVRAGKGDVLNLRIPGPTFQQISQENDRIGEQWRRIYGRKYTEDQLAAFEDLKSRVGGRFIEFRRIAPGKGCEYGTNDPVVAEYIRSRMTGQYKVDGLYEDFATSMLRSKYTDQLFPNTEDGRNQLGQYDLAFELAVQKQAALASQVVSTLPPKTTVGEFVLDGEPIAPAPKPKAAAPTRARRSNAAKPGTSKTRKTR